MEANYIEVALEGLIDKSSVKTVLEAITDICNAKAGHIRSNWQDEPLARSWEREANTIDRILPQINH